jgi:hypothetical protein
MKLGVSYSGVSMRRQEGCEIRRRDACDSLDPVCNKQFVVNPPPHSPRRDAEAVGDLRHRKEFLHIGALTVGGVPAATSDARESNRVSVDKKHTTELTDTSPILDWRGHAR